MNWKLLPGAQALQFDWRTVDGSYLQRQVWPVTRSTLDPTQWFLFLRSVCRGFMHDTFHSCERDERVYSWRVFGANFLVNNDGLMIIQLMMSHTVMPGSIPKDSLEAHRSKVLTRMETIIAETFKVHYSEHVIFRVDVVPRVIFMAKQIGTWTNVESETLVKADPEELVKADPGNLEGGLGIAERFGDGLEPTEISAATFKPRHCKRCGNSWGCMCPRDKSGENPSKTTRVHWHKPHLL